MSLKSRLIVLTVLMTNAMLLVADDMSPYQVKMFNAPQGEEFAFDNYRMNWTRMTGFEFSGLHWNQFITVYVRGGESVYQNNYLQYITWYEDPDEFEEPPKYQKYPINTVVLKENFQAKDGKPHAPLTVTAMIKRNSNFDPENGNWEYLQFDPKGKIILRGKASDPTIQTQCAHCHSHIADRDYIFSQIFSATDRE